MPRPAAGLLRSLGPFCTGLARSSNRHCRPLAPRDGGRGWAVSYQVVGEAADWAARAEELAENTECLFVNRTDVWGGYYETRDDAGDFVTHQVTNPRKADLGRV